MSTGPPVTAGLAFTQLLARADDGCSAAAGKLFELFGAEVERWALLALRGLRLQDKVESADLVQIVWSAFFRLRAKAEEFAGPENVLAYLRRMTAYQAAKHARQYHGARRDVKREVPLADVSDTDAPPPADRAPDPAHQAIADEMWQQLMATRSPRDQEVLRLQVEQCTQAEIATKVGIDERTVRKILDKAKADLERIRQ